jgi:hypothetical protein
LRTSTIAMDRIRKRVASLSNAEDIQGRSGFVPPAYMAIVASKTAATAKAIGGWP